MFFRIMKGTLLRRRGKRMMIILTIALGVSLATAMLNVMTDVGDKVNAELKGLGANITVLPRNTAVLSNIYDSESSGALSNASLQEEELGKVKTIFWSQNILDYAPFLDTPVEVGPDQVEVKLLGTWFDHRMDLPGGQTIESGIGGLRSWWKVDGDWVGAGDVPEVMVGRRAAERIHVGVGDSISANFGENTVDLKVTGIFDAGSEENELIYAPLHIAQKLSDREGQISRIEISALTTPDNDIARKAAKNPESLTKAEHETWYCTAYVSAISFQLEEALTDSVAKPVRHIAESEGEILKKTQLLMVLITALTLLGCAISIANLVTANVVERAPEIGLLKAVGASDSAVIALILGEILVLGLIGGGIGYFIGLGFAQVIGHTIFDTAIAVKPWVIPMVVTLMGLVVMAGSLPACRFLLRLRPAEVLHGR